MDEDQEPRWSFQQLAQAIGAERPRQDQEQARQAEASHVQGSSLHPSTSSRGTSQQFTLQDAERWSRRSRKDNLNEYERVWRVRQVTGIEERQQRIRQYKEHYPQEWKAFVESLNANYAGMMESKGEIENKKKVVQWLGAHLKRFKPSAYLATGGSTVSNLGTSASDLDLCICVHCGPGVDAYPE
ncbi:hypothetical protein AAVH_34056, partial [Aphelenchoides avenae]